MNRHRLAQDWPKKHVRTIAIIITVTTIVLSRPSLYACLCVVSPESRSVVLNRIAFSDMTPTMPACLRHRARLRIICDHRHHHCHRHELRQEIVAGKWRRRTSKSQRVSRILASAPRFTAAKDVLKEMLWVLALPSAAPRLTFDMVAVRLALTRQLTCSFNCNSSMH